MGIKISQIEQELNTITGDDYIIVSAKNDGTYITKKFKPNTMINQDEDLINIRTISFDTTIDPGDVTEGQLKWNNTEQTLDLGLPDDSVLQLGQELFVMGRNTSNDTLLNGTAVYESDSQGIRPILSKARSDSHATSKVIGLVTHDIAKNGTGRVTTFGYVRQIKTNYTGTGTWGTTWTEGDTLWVSKTDAGKLTNVEPEVPHHADIVGTVGVIGSAGTGSIFVCIQRHVSLEEASDINGTDLTTTGQVPSWNNELGYFDFEKNIVDITPDTARIGTETNNTSFDEDGHQTMNGNATVFKDELQSLLTQLKNNPADRLVENIAEGTLDFKSNAVLADYAVMNVQINHDAKIGANVYPHLHFFQNQNAMPNWMLQYRWQSNGQIKDATWKDLRMNAPAFTYISGILVQIAKVATPITPPETARLSDVLQLRLIRDTNNASTLFTGSDPYTGNAEALNFDVHYEINSIGSNQEYVK